MQKVKVGHLTKCPICGKEFYKETSPQKYCSKMCSYRHQIEKAREKYKEECAEERENARCLYCGKIYDKKRVNQKYCSVECKRKSNNAYKPKPEAQSSKKVRSLEEVMRLMKEMDYGHSFGKFCMEHPELLTKE